MDNFREEELYAPVKEFFRKQGYVVRGEVGRCDIALVKDGELAVVELKKSFNMTLLYQAIDRQKISNMVYIAIPRKAFMKKRSHILHILEKMGMGLLTVAMDSPSRLVEAHLLPNMGKARNNRRTKALLAEFNGRTFDGNLGGGAGHKLMTAHRERALHIACALERAGQAGPAKLIAAYSCHKNTVHMLPRNLYNWYTKIEKGVYTLSETGRAALADPRYAQIVAYYRKAVKSCITAENPE